jgi:hypothetical protein
MLIESCKRYQAKGGIPMMSPHTHIALRYDSDAESARKAARRPDALPEPDEQPSSATEPDTGARFRILARLHLAPAKHA